MDLLAQGWSMLAQSPVVTLALALAIFMTAWKIAGFAYRERIEALKAQGDLKEERLKLANDRLLQSNEQLEELRAKAKEKVKIEFPEPDLRVIKPGSVWIEEYDKALGKIIRENTDVVTISSSPSYSYVSPTLISKKKPEKDSKAD